VPDIESGEFPRKIAGLSGGDAFDLRIAPIVKQIGDAAVRMLAYNGSVPGPILKVRQGSEIVTLEHRHQVATHPLATFSVGGKRAEPSYAAEFELRRSNPDLAAERDRIEPYLSAPPDKTLAFVAEMDLGAHDGSAEYACPMHWHGVRVENRYDGTHETQAPIPVGGDFTYRVQFPDPGLYWYHPHIRADYGPSPSATR